MFERILVPVDARPGDGPSHRALGIARRFDSELHVLHVIDPQGLVGEDRSAIRESLEPVGREAIDRVADRAEEVGIHPVRELRQGTADRVIVEYADEHDIDLLVMGTHARGGSSDPRLGSSTERVVLASRSPVLAVPRREDSERDGIDVIVIATDGSDASERAAERGLHLAEAYDATVEVVYVVDTETYHLSDAPRRITGLLKEGGRRAMEAITEATDRPVTTALRRGIPEEELLAFAEDRDADLVVMGVSGRGGAGNRFLGSTTARVLRHSSRPILTVR